MCLGTVEYDVKWYFSEIAIRVLQDVNVTNGVVTLAGEVPNAQVKAEAEHEARTTGGVVKVINNLQVKSPPAS